MKATLGIMLLPLVAGCAAYRMASIETSYHREEPYDVTNADGTTTTAVAVTEFKSEGKAGAGDVQHLKAVMEEQYETASGSFSVGHESSQELGGRVEALLGTNAAISNTVLGLGGMLMQVQMADLMYQNHGGNGTPYLDALLGLLGR